MDMETVVFNTSKEHTEFSHGVMHGPWPPIGEHGLMELQRWEGDEYDLTDIALQGLYQIHCNWRAIDTALRYDNIPASEAKILWDKNQTEYDLILDQYLTR